METQQQIQKSQEIANINRELQRRALDQLKVLNPIKESFKTIFDGFTHNVEAGQERVLSRYIAEKWMREFIDFSINRDAQEALDKENKKRLSKGWQAMNKHTEELDFISGKGLLTSNPTLRAHYLKTVYRGVSEEHGLDIPVAPTKPRDTRSLDQRLLEELDAELGTKFPEPTEGEVSNEELESKKDELLKGIE